MSWSLLSPIEKKQDAEVVASLCRLGKSTDNPIRLSLIFRSGLLARFKMPKTMSVAVGASAPHEGQLRISPEGDFQLKPFSRGGGRLLLPRPQGLPNEIKPSMACAVQIQGKDLIITLPEWKATTAASSHLATRHLVEHSNRNGTGGNVAEPRNVTSSIMGDPPAGRSALDMRKSGR